MTISLYKNISRVDTIDDEYTEIKPSLMELQSLLYKSYGNSNTKITLYDMLCILLGRDPTAVELVTITINPIPSNATVVLEMKE